MYLDSTVATASSYGLHIDKYTSTQSATTDQTNWAGDAAHLERLYRDGIKLQIIYIYIIHIHIHIYIDYTVATTSSYGVHIDTYTSTQSATTDQTNWAGDTAHLERLYRDGIKLQGMSIYVIHIHIHIYRLYSRDGIKLRTPYRYIYIYTICNHRPNEPSWWYCAPRTTLSRRHQATDYIYIYNTYTYAYI